MKRINDKLYKHFDKLAIRQKEMQNIDFDDLNSITKVQRYKFNTNNFLENLLLKNDSAVKDWIDKQKRKNFAQDTI